MNCYRTGCRDAVITIDNGKPVCAVHYWENNPKVPLPTGSTAQKPPTELKPKKVELYRPRPRMPGRFVR